MQMSPEFLEVIEVDRWRPVPTRSEGYKSPLTRRRMPGCPAPQSHKGGKGELVGKVIEPSRDHHRAPFEIKLSDPHRKSRYPRVGDERDGQKVKVDGHTVIEKTRIKSLARSLVRSGVC